MKTESCRTDGSFYKFTFDVILREIVKCTYYIIPETYRFCVRKKTIYLI